MLNKSILIILLFLVLTSTVSAEPEVTGLAVPRNLHVYNAAGNTYVDHEAHGCSNTRYYINPNHIKYDTIVSILMTAQIAGKKVVLRYDGCNTITQGNIIGVYLQGN